MSEVYQLENVQQVKNNLLQSVIGILRDWVFDRNDSFTIIDIYMNPDLSEKLCLNREMLKTVQSALLKLNCTISRDRELLDNEYLFDTYQPPRVKRIDRDLMVS